MLNLSLPLGKASDVDHKRERLLIEAAKHGDTEAFSEIYNTHVDAIFHYIYMRISIRQTAEDITGDVFLRVLESLPTYEDRGLPILAWMYRIAHDRVIDYYRSAKHTENLQDVDTVQIRVEDNVDQALMSAYQAEAIYAAIRTLSFEQQQVIMLRFVEGHSLEITSELLGKKVGAIKSLQFRAVQALSKALQTLRRTTGE